MTEQENHIDNLIAKYLAGEASAQEVAEFELWLNQSETNRKYFEQEKTIFARSSQLKEWQEYDTDEAWESLKNKIREKPGRIIPFNKGFQWFSIAASILLVATIGYFLLRGNEVAVQPEIWSINAVAEVKQDTLPDGSRAFLNKGTELTYSFVEKENKRKVEIQGEAYFDIENKKENGFQIEVGELIIEDIGTSFNVNAYPKSKLVTVIVEKGEVALYTINDPGIRVLAGETGIYNKTTQTFAKISEADPNALAYKTRYFSFNNTLLENVTTSLNEVYGVNIRLAKEKLKNCRISVTFRDEDIDSILEIIAATLELKITRITDNEIILEGEGCDD